jgi:hypothetical protein
MQVLSITSLKLGFSKALVGRGLTLDSDKGSNWPGYQLKIMEKSAIITTPEIDGLV